MNLVIHRSPIAPSAAVSISFKAQNVNWFVLQKLKAERPCGCAELAYSSEYTALVYSIYDSVRDKLIGTAGNQLKSKVNNVGCGMCHGNFIISFTCHNSVTGIRKSLGLAMSKMNPAKLYPRYQKYIRLLGGKPIRAEFLNCVNAIGQIKPNVTVVTKSKITPETKAKVSETVIKKLYSFEKAGGSKVPASSNKEPGVTEFVYVTPSGFGIMFVIQFLDFLNIPSIQADDKVIIFARSIPKIQPAKVDRFVKMTFGKMADKLTNAALYSAISGSILCAGHIKSMIDAKITPAKISKILKDSLT